MSATDPSHRFAEDTVPLFQERHRRPERHSAWHEDALVVNALEAVEEHRTVDLDEHVRPDLDRVVRPDAHDVGVEGRVMDLAESQPVRYDRPSLGVSVREDMGRVQKLLVPEMADGARR